MGVSQTEHTEIWVLARQNRPKYGYWTDRTDRNMGIGQTEQTEIWVLDRPNRPKYGHWPDRTDRNMGIGQTEQTKIWVLDRPNRPKYGYWPDRTDRNMGNGQTEQTEIWILARPIKPKYGYWPDRTDRNCHWPDGRRDPNFFQTIVDGRIGPPCPRPKSVWPIPVLGLGLHPGLRTEILKMLLYLKTVINYSKLY